MSTGPVGVGDKSGFSNVDLIMKTCNAEGLLLKPSRPLTSIDHTFKSRAFDKSFGALGTIQSTWSLVSEHLFDIVLGASLTSASTVLPSMLNSYRLKSSFGPEKYQVAYQASENGTTFENINFFNEASGVTLSSSDSSGYELWYVFFKFILPQSNDLLVFEKITSIFHTYAYRTWYYQL